VRDRREDFALEEFFQSRDTHRILFVCLCSRELDIGILSERHQHVEQVAPLEDVVRNQRPEAVQGVFDRDLKVFGVPEYFLAWRLLVELDLVDNPFQDDLDLIDHSEFDELDDVETAQVLSFTLNNHGDVRKYTVDEYGDHEHFAWIVLLLNWSRCLLFIHLFALLCCHL